MGMVTQAQTASQHAASQHAASQHATTQTSGTASWWPSRYGADDQAGALNEITPGKVLEAVRLVRCGSA
jgi:hypothetical protein